MPRDHDLKAKAIWTRSWSRLLAHGSWKGRPCLISVTLHVSYLLGVRLCYAFDIALPTLHSSTCARFAHVDLAPTRYSCETSASRSARYLYAMQRVTSPYASQPCSGA
jgi:hypothetical protein